MDTSTLNYLLASPKSIPQSAFEVTTSDSGDLPKIATGLHIGTSANGSVTVETLEGVNVTFLNVIQGQRLETGSIKKVLETGTTATNLVAYYYVTIQPTT